MPNVTALSTSSSIKPPPVTVPAPPNIWLKRRFGLSDATARAVAELAWPSSASWIGSRR